MRVRQSRPKLGRRGFARRWTRFRTLCWLDVLIGVTQTILCLDASDGCFARPLIRSGRRRRPRSFCFGGTATRYSSPCASIAFRFGGCIKRFTVIADRCKRD